MEETIGTGEPKKLPTFLKVLCILSYIGVAIVVISNIYSLMTFEATIATMKSMMGLLGGAGESAFAGVAAIIKHGKTLYIVNIIAALICLVGVLQMWKMKKTGYYIYIVGEIAPAIATFSLIGGFGVLGFGALVGSLIFPILFIVLYGLNLKHMS